MSATNTVLGMNPDGRKIAHGAKQFDGQRVTGERDCGSEATKLGGSWFHGYRKGQGPRNHGSKSPKRKAASAQIAKIPEPLARWIAQVYKPSGERPDRLDATPEGVVANEKGAPNAR